MCMCVWGGGVCVCVYNFMKIEGETMGVYMNMRKIQLYKKYSYIYLYVCINMSNEAHFFILKTSLKLMSIASML